MNLFACPYCNTLLTEEEVTDRSKTVYWIAFPQGRVYAHTDCWMKDEIKEGPKIANGK